MMRRFLLIALLASVPSNMLAQRMGFGVSHFSGHSFHGERGIEHAGRFGRGGGSFLLPWLDPLYVDYLSSTGYPAASEPPVIILQTPPAAVAERTPSPLQPLMIELRGNAYVQISGDADPQQRTIDATLASAIAPPAIENCHPGRIGCGAKPSILGVEEPLTAPPNPAAVLIFRDGHLEEVSNYTITDGALYASADYITSGTWTRKIDLASLNLPETVSSNQSRGVQFRVPQAPNEVVVGP